MLIEILAEKGLTHGGTTYAKGALAPPDDVLMMLAQPGHLHAGEQACRIYDPEQTAAEAKAEKEAAAKRSLPSLDVVEKAAHHYGYVMMLKADVAPYNRELEAMHYRLMDAKRELEEVKAANADLQQLLLNQVTPAADLQQMQGLLAIANEENAALKHQLAEAVDAFAMIQFSAGLEAMEAAKAEMATVDNSAMLTAMDSAGAETLPAGENPGELAEAAEPPAIAPEKPKRSR